MRIMVVYVRIKGFVWHVYTILKQHMLQRKKTQLTPIAISEKYLQLENAAMRTVCCSLGQRSTG